MRVSIPAVGLALAALLGGCGGGDGGGEGKVAVVATTPYVADFVAEVGGDFVEVERLIDPNVDPHRYVPVPSDTEAIAEAELVFVSGRGIDEWAEGLVSESRGNARIVNLGVSGPIRLKGGHSHGGGARAKGNSEVGHAGHSHGTAESELDPHWWHDPRNVEAAVPAIENSLVIADPAHRDEFIRNADEYTGELRALDVGIAKCISSLPAARRKIVTDDFAFAYFANRYGIELIRTTIPTGARRGDASARELDGLIATIEAEGVKAIFPRWPLGAEVIEAIAQRAGASTAYSLHGDTLGPEGSDSDTYLRMEAANADALVRGLTGGKLGCDLARRLS